MRSRSREIKSSFHASIHQLSEMQGRREAARVFGVGALDCDGLKKRRAEQVGEPAM